MSAGRDVAFVPLKEKEKENEKGGKKNKETFFFPFTFSHVSFVPSESSFFFKRFFFFFFKPCSFFWFVFFPFHSVLIFSLIHSNYLLFTFRLRRQLPTRILVTKETDKLNVHLPRTRLRTV